MSHRCLQMVFLKPTLWFSLQSRQLHLLGNHVIWKFDVQKQWMSSNTQPLDITNIKKRPKSRIPIVNWFYDDLLKGGIKMNAFFMYAGLTKQVNYMDFFKLCQLDDTFNSWFLVTELHVWMLMVRLRSGEKDGRTACNSLVAALWDDSTTRAKVLSPGDSSVSKKQIQVLAQEFRASLLIYDEGLLTSDTVLASALWFRLLSKSCDDPRVLELLTAYVRDQVHNLEKTSNDDLLLRASYTWKPLQTRLMAAEA